MIVIEITDARLPSWNILYEGKHWSARSQMAHLWHALTREALDKLDLEILDYKVDIDVMAEYKHPAYDSDNICAKLVIDGMKGRLIYDDSPKWVGWVSCKSVLSDQDRVTITVKPVMMEFE